LTPVREEDLKGFTPVLMIRLARFGARKQPYYRVVVIEKDRARNGRSIEVVGTYNPRTHPATVDLKRERIEHWTSWRLIPPRQPPRSIRKNTLDTTTGKRSNARS
jgi:small subunit ribosomal protein S16